MGSVLKSLGVELPVVAAPMAGGPSTPALVAAVARAGGLGFLAAGYRTAQRMSEEIAGVRATASAFGVNLFAPNPLPVGLSAFRTYARALQPVADRFGVMVESAEPVEDDDDWAAKIDVLIRDPVPVVSFTFGIPDGGTVARLRAGGSLVIQTVTSADEARRARDAGVDALAAQASVAGGHWGTLTPQQPPATMPLAQLTGAVIAASELPVIAAGGVTDTEQVRDLLGIGAEAVAVGTLLLRADESGASDVHKAALVEARGEPVLTRAFTGRPARGLPNEFIRRYDELAPFGYPAVHHLTSGLRKAAAAAGDPEWVNLWAGVGYRAATAEPAEVIVRRLSAAL